ncbi:MAG: hypothetical protein VX278_15780 [Myxococcota bacterium]|nr:hypothetical protein [Myxococcota bacterium]
MFLLFYFLCIFFSHATPTTPEGVAKEQLRNAETWYYLARLTENDKSAHELSKEAYEEAIEKLKGINTSEANHLRQQAQRGLNQTVSRIDNAHDTVRNVLWPIWWITEEDPTVEWYDDLYMKATEISWNLVSHQMDQLKNPTRIPVITRASRNAQLPAKSLIDDPEMTIEDRTGLLRDELLSYADMTNNLYGVSDDMGSRIFENLWPKIISQQDLTTEDLQTIGQNLSTNKVMILDIEIIDEIPMREGHASVVRLNTQAHVWNTDNGTLLHHIYVQGIGQDVRSQNFMAVLWVLTLFAIAMGTTILRARLLNTSESELNWSGIAGIAFVAFIGGSFLGEFAGEVSSEFLQDWGTPSFLRELDYVSIPYPPVFIWPFVHGAVVMVGPLFILAWASIKMGDYIEKFVDDPQSHMSIIAPAAQAGATTWMFYPLVEAVPVKGLWTALPLSAAAIITSFVIAVPLSGVLSGRVIQRKTIIGLAVGTLALLQLLPIGMYNDNVWLATLIGALSVVFISWYLGKETLVHAPPEKAVESVDDDIVLEVSEQIGSLEEPTWLDITQDQNIVEQLQQNRHIHIDGISKYGATRTLREIEKQLQQRGSKTIMITLNEPSELVDNPYGLISDIYAQIGIRNLNLASQEEFNRTFQEGILQTESLVAMFPGFGPIVDVLSESEGGGDFLRSRVIEDGAKVLIEAFDEHGIQVVFLENLHWADPSSLEVLERFFEMCPQPPSFIWNTTFQEEPHLISLHQKIKDLQPLTHFKLPRLNLEQAKAFISNAGIQRFPDELLDTLISASDGSVGGLHLLLLLMKENELLVPHTFNNRIIYTPIQNITSEMLWESLPQDLQEQELNRLQSLSRETLFVLECAALCGSTFSIDELEAGSDRSKQDILLKLEEIERLNPPVIEDLPSVDRHFRFVNNLTRIALVKRLTLASKDTMRELAKSVHQSILKKHVTDDILSPEKSIHHAMPLQNTAHILCPALLALLEQFAQKSAWPEIIKVYTALRTRIEQYDAPVQKLKIDIIAAKAFRFTGGQQNRDRAQEILQKHIQNPALNLTEQSEPTLFSLFFTLCETIFEEKDVEELQDLHTLCTENLEKPFSPLLHEIFRFYQSFAHSVINRNTPMLDDLQSILERLQTIPEPHSHEYRFFYAVVFQTFANKSWYENLPERGDPDGFEKQKALFQDTVLPRLDEALTLKKDLNDVQGMAMNYGMRGAIYLFNLREGSKALHAFTEDWNLVEENNLSSDKPGMLNKLSLTHKLLSSDSSAAKEDQQASFRKAQELALEALHLAQELEREWDFAFALSNTLDLALQEATIMQSDSLSEATMNNLQTLGEYATSEEYWNRKAPVFLKGDIYQKASALPEFPWTSTVVQCTKPPEADT